MKKRECRRDRTYRLGERRRKRHLALNHPNGVVDCVCDLSVWKFDKDTGRGCGCRGRKYGQPKRGAGPCFHYGRDLRPAVVDRITAKRWCRRVRSELLADVDRTEIVRRDECLLRW